MKNKYLFSIFFLVCLFLIPSFISAQEVKNALLIANNEYGGNVESLPRPIDEARNLKIALESIGFNVVIVENANRERMEDALFNFKEKCLKEGGISFFHYGGHALQIDGINYLLPAKTQLDSMAQVRFKCVNVENLMTSMQGDANIVVLDSCRNNPFKSGTRGGTSVTRGGTTTRGLAPIHNRPKNSIIVYSADSNEVANDGVFTPILTKYIIEKNISIENILKKVRREVLQKTGRQQLTAEYSQLTGQVYLAGNYDSGVVGKTLSGFMDISTYTTCHVFLDNEYIGEVQDFSQKRFEIATGVHKVKIKYKDGKSENIDVVIRLERKESLNLTYLSKEQIQACISLGDKYRYGADVSGRNEGEAFKYYKLVADAGNSYGEAQVAFSFEEGKGVTQNEEEAFEWYIKASKGGNGLAMCRLGIFYFYGKGKCKIDYNEAKKYFEKAIIANYNKESVDNAERYLKEIAEKLEEGKGSIAKYSYPAWAVGLYSFEIYASYNFSKFENAEISFNTHGFTLGLTDARLNFKNGFDMKFRSNYSFNFKRFTSEQISYNEFNPLILQIGYRSWFGFHVGMSFSSLQWETINSLNSSSSITATNFIYSFTFPIDLELKIYDRFSIYAEYSPRIPLAYLKHIIPFVQHSFSIGIQIRVADAYL